jgi:hypothetical protein
MPLLGALDTTQHVSCMYGMYKPNVEFLHLLLIEEFATLDLELLLLLLGLLFDLLLHLLLLLRDLLQVLKRNLCENRNGSPNKKVCGKGYKNIRTKRCIFLTIGRPKY